MEYYYYAKKKLSDLYYSSAPSIPQNILDVPIVTFGFIAITTITLAAVTIMDNSTSENGSGESSNSDSSLSSPFSLNMSGGKEKKNHHNKTKQKNRYRNNKTR